MCPYNIKRLANQFLAAAPIPVTDTMRGNFQFSVRGLCGGAECVTGD